MTFTVLEELKQDSSYFNFKKEAVFVKLSLHS